MNKNVLIITTSPRKNGNSDRLAAAFEKGAVEAGNQVETASLIGKTIGFCHGCLACQKTGRCVIDDDAWDITQKMGKADVIVFATPIYYYEMPGQMKTMLDRANPLYDRDYAFRDVYFLSTAADDEEGMEAGAKSGLEGWIECFPKARLAGSVFAGGVTEKGEIEGHPALETARQMGRQI